MNSDDIEMKNDLQKTEQSPMQRLEHAMVHCGFGRFHYRLLLAALCACFANNLLTINTSFLLPSAECDLGMDMMQKGLLNAVPFIGMITSGVFSGFVTDAFGRRRFLVCGYFGVFLSCLVEGTSQSYGMLVLGKFMEGVCLTIGFNPNTTIVPELTHKDIRDRVMMVFSTFKCIAVVVLVAKSWAILAQSWDFVVVEGLFEIHTWSIYLYLCGSWGLLASVQYYFLPESPKFLLAQGKHEEALQILKMIYCTNTGKPPDTFPVKSLASSSQTMLETKTSAKNKMMKSLIDLKSLFERPLFSKLVIFCIMTMLNMFAYNTFRLWYPQLSTIIESHDSEHNTTDSLCSIIDTYLNKSVVNVEDVSDVTECIAHPSGSQTYINGIVMGFVCLLCHIISALFINHVSQKTILLVYLVLCSISSSALYWSYSGLQVMGLVSVVVGFTQATTSLLFTMIVRVFPTTVRSLSVAIITMLGRIGSTTGNLLFPLMLQTNCMMPFFTVSVITLCIAVMVFLLPNPSRDNKETGDN